MKARLAKRRSAAIIKVASQFGSAFCAHETLGVVFLSKGTGFVELNRLRTFGAVDFFEAMRMNHGSLTNKIFSSNWETAFCAAILGGGTIFA